MQDVEAKNRMVVTGVGTRCGEQDGGAWRCLSRDTDSQLERSLTGLLQGTATTVDNEVMYISKI